MDGWMLIASKWMTRQDTPGRIESRGGYRDRWRQARRDGIAYRSDPPSRSRQQGPNGVPGGL